MRSLFKGKTGLALTGLILALFMTANTLWTLTLAQDEQTIISAAECGTAISQFWLTASDACVGKPFGFVCNGGSSPLVEPAGVVSNSLVSVGALVEIGVVDALRTSSIQARAESGGIAWLRVSAEDSPLRFSGLLVGDVNIRDVTPDGFPAWQSLTVETIDATEHCEAAPHSSLVLQSLPGQTSRVVVNGISLDIDGTAVIQTEGTGTHFMSISGSLGLLSAGQRANVFAGQEITVSYNPDDFTIPISGPGLPSAYREDRVANLPVLLFDFPVQVPQSGLATTLGQVNLRTAPNTDAAVLMQAQAGERLSILGRNPAGDWFHVQLANGQTGWMFAELLNVTGGEVNTVYESTPQPLQRMGNLGTAAQVIAPNGVTMRSAPDMSFASLATLSFGQQLTLLNRSPYSPWVKVDAGGQVGWVALITLETRAIIDALPVDYDVPPPPEPTRIPGSFGNAFPDPNCYPNCG